jgi:hypothetical protein
MKWLARNEASDSRMFLLSAVWNGINSLAMIIVCTVIFPDYEAA